MTFFFFPPPTRSQWHHLGADELAFDADCGSTKQAYHGFINDMNAFVRGRNRTLIVWGGFDPAPTDVAAVDKTVVVSPFDSVRWSPWPHRPHHYYAAGYVRMWQRQCCWEEQG